MFPDISVCERNSFHFLLLLPEDEVKEFYSPFVAHYTRDALILSKY